MIDQLIYYSLPAQSVFYGNRSACYFALEEYLSAIEDCTKALEYNENYSKVLMRRCQSYERLSKFDEAIKGITVMNY